MNWTALRDILAPACGLGVFAVLGLVLFFAFAASESEEPNDPLRRTAERALILTLCTESILFLFLLVAASQVPQ